MEFVLNGSTTTFIPSNQLQNHDYSQLKVVKFSMLHAKSIRNNFGDPIWFSTTQAGRPVRFVQLVYLWSKISLRLH